MKYKSREERAELVLSMYEDIYYNCIQLRSMEPAEAHELALALTQSATMLQLDDSIQGLMLTIGER